MRRSDGRVGVQSWRSGARHLQSGAAEAGPMVGLCDRCACSTTFNSRITRSRMMKPNLFVIVLTLTSIVSIDQRK